MCTGIAGHVTGVADGAGGGSLGSCEVYRPRTAGIGARRAEAPLVRVSQSAIRRSGSGAGSGS